MKNITLSGDEKNSLSLNNFKMGTEDVVIQVENLYKRYGKLVAVKGINFTVKRGEIFGIIGPDGAGKTTTFHILSGVMEASDGKIQVLNKSPRYARLSISYLTQQFSLHPDLSVDENLRYSAGLGQVRQKQFVERRKKYLRLMNLEKFINRLAGNLSGGMKQKLALCCALISRPQILLLDEPTTGVDPVSRREFWDILGAVANEGVTIVVATPYLDEAERCHRIALMHEGYIKQIGTPSHLRDSLNLQRLEVRTNEIEAAECILHKQLNVKQTSISDVQTFGDRLDILVEDTSVGIAEVRAMFKQHQLKLNSIQTTDVTLENVFMASLRTTGDEPEFVPFPHSKEVRKQKLTGGIEEIDSSIAIGAKKLRKVFGDFQAVKSIDLEIRYGEIYGLLGANGAGKTTTIKMLCGLLEPTAGKISLAGQTRNLRSKAVRQRIGYMSQKFTLYDDLTILQNLQFYCGVYGIPNRLRRARINWVLTTCGLLGKENMLTGKLPGGWKQRVAFGASVMHEPEILFLDEPTSGVDPLARHQLWRLINDFARQGTAILITTHYLEEAEQCNRIGFMVGGEMVTQSSPSEIKAAQPGKLFEVVTKPTQEAANLLKTQLEAWRVSIFGDRLHVVFDEPELEIPHMRSMLLNNGINIQSVRVIPFSLEDAFMGIVQRVQTHQI